MSALDQVYAQFRRPRGLLGALAGWTMATRPSNRARNVWTIGLLNLRAGDSLLEVGCGPGVGLEAALAAASLSRVTGLDHSEVMIAQARSRLRGAAQDGRLQLICGEFGDPGLQLGRFDRICSANVIQFLPDRAQALGAMQALLNPGGRIATTYQPRGRSPTRAAAFAMGETLSAIMRDLGFINVRTRILEIKPAPAVCVLGELAA